MVVIFCRYKVFVVPQMYNKRITVVSTYLFRENYWLICIYLTFGEP